MGCWSAATAVAVAIVVAMVAGQASAKRGCINFGHSCFGGQGKRGLPGGPVGPPTREETPMGGSAASDDADPAFVFTGPRSWPPAGARGPPVPPLLFQQPPEEVEAAARALRQWILSNYRREQDMSDV